MSRQWTPEEKRYAASQGARLRKMREGLGLSLDEFGERIGVHRNSIWRWETGKTMPNPYQLRLIRNLAKSVAVQP